MGSYNPTAGPRFGFRGTDFVAGQGNWAAIDAHVLPEVLPTGGPAGELAAPSCAAATLLRLDRSRDLALLRIDGAPLPTLALAEAGAVREGQSIAIMGFPIGGALGYTPVTHRGIVASVTVIALPAPTARSLNPQAIDRLRQGSFDIYQLDATAYPGNSGGPVLDGSSGKVMGGHQHGAGARQQGDCAVATHRHQLRDTGALRGGLAGGALNGPRFRCPALAGSSACSRRPWR